MKLKKGKFYCSLKKGTFYMFFRKNGDTETGKPKRGHVSLNGDVWSP